MKAKLPLDRRPLVVAIAGPNGAGKTTFYYAHLREAALRFVNADALARELSLDAYAAAKAADVVRRELIRQRESFVFETVFSDPVGEKVAFLKSCIDEGYTVVLCFIGIVDSDVSEQRVSMRVSQGGHDVPTEKLKSRFARTLTNLRLAMRDLPIIHVFDNSDLNHPFRKVVVLNDGKVAYRSKRLPPWLPPLP